MHCVGLFDSGLGGLTVWDALRQQAPGLPCLYLADQAHLPYGPRSREQIQSICGAICEQLLSEGAELIVVACNTASAAALQSLRTRFPTTPFVGMEPAVKPAALQTRSGAVGLMATQGTLRGELLRATAARFAGHVRLISSDCPGLADAIEQAWPAERLISLLQQQLAPMIEAGVDTVVLGCSHYPLITPIIQQVLGPGVRLIDPSAAVARQVLRLWPHPLPASASTPRFASSAATTALQQFLLRQFNTRAEVEAWRWNQGRLSRPAPI